MRFPLAARDVVWNRCELSRSARDLAKVGNPPTAAGSRTIKDGPLSTQPVWKPSLCTQMKNIWKVTGRLTNHDCEISSTSDQILRAGDVWVGFHTGWTQSGQMHGKFAPADPRTIYPLASAAKSLTSVRSLPLSMRAGL
jgi:CubicO group peptidase (beta-lactamase class C family)